MPKRRAGSPVVPLLTCEHGGNRIPPEHRAHFRGKTLLLESHRGWDPGALAAARSLSRSLGTPLHAVTWSRLLVEANRSPTNPRIWSAQTEDLSREARAGILDRYWWPHRRAVEKAVRTGVSRGARVVHVAVHSFSPRLDGVLRNADVGLLYDSRRRLEGRFCRAWRDRLRELDPNLRIRMNYPYRGTADGLTTWLRERFPERAYLGIELELNQALLATPGRRALLRNLAQTLGSLLAPGPRPRDAKRRQIGHRTS